MSAEAFGIWNFGMPITSLERLQGRREVRVGGGGTGRIAFDIVGQRRFDGPGLVGRFRIRLRIFGPLRGFCRAAQLFLELQFLTQ